MVDPKIKTNGYLSLLVEVGMFDYIKMSFLPVGHTHEDVDQAFSRIVVYLNRHDAIDMDEFIHAVEESFVKDEEKTRGEHNWCSFRRQELPKGPPT